MITMETKDEKALLAKRAFDIIQLLEMTEITDKSFNVIRKKLLDLGNDILRLGTEAGVN